MPARCLFRTHLRSSSSLCCIAWPSLSGFSITLCFFLFMLSKLSKYYQTLILVSLCQKLRLYKAQLTQLIRWKSIELSVSTKITDILRISDYLLAISIHCLAFFHIIWSILIFSNVIRAFIHSIYLFTIVIVILGNIISKGMDFQRACYRSYHWFILDWHFRFRHLLRFCFPHYWWFRRHLLTPFYF
mgnify:CR=1 FL=1